MISTETITAGLGIRLSERAKYAMGEGITLGLNRLTALCYDPPHGRQDRRVEWAHQLGIEIGRQVLAFREMEKRAKVKRREARLKEQT